MIERLIRLCDVIDIIDSDDVFELIYNYPTTADGADFIQEQIIKIVKDKINA